MSDDTPDDVPAATYRLSIAAGEIKRIRDGSGDSLQAAKGFLLRERARQIITNEAGLSDDMRQLLTAMAERAFR